MIGHASIYFWDFSNISDLPNTVGVQMTGNSWDKYHKKFFVISYTSFTDIVWTIYFHSKSFIEVQVSENNHVLVEKKILSENLLPLKIESLLITIFN